MLPITGCAILEVIYPAGPVHTVFTVAETSTNGLIMNSTVQMRVILDPIGRIGVTGALLRITDSGAGTIELLSRNTFKLQYSINI